MRLSVRKDDPGYPAWSRIDQKAEVRVYLDGIQVEECITADEEAGYVLCNKLKNGKPFITKTQEVATEKRHGRVEIRVDGAPVAASMP